jgi:actin-related protein
VRHRLPDGTEVSLGEETTLAPEALFHPALVGKECSGVVGVAAEAIRKCDLDIRRDMYSNIFLAGGSSLFSNFCNRFLADMTKHTPKDCKVRLMAPSNRKMMAWTGASSLTQLPNFKDLLVTKGEYLEEGERILHSKLIC